MDHQAPDVRLQNLRDFTVWIQCADTEEIVGTGVAISPDGKIVTCAHVVRAAGVEPREAAGAEVGVCFPESREDASKTWRATVAACFSDYEDDVVLLQLVGGPSPLAQEQIAVLGRAEGSEGHAFRSYGYAPLGDRLSGYPTGKITGPIKKALLPGKRLQADLIELHAENIRPGMSGGAVLDEARNLVVGLMTERWNPEGNPENNNLGWATDGCVLAFDPFGLPLQDAPLPLRAAPQPKIDLAEAQAAARPSQKLAGAPSPLKEWVGRAALLHTLGEDWTDPGKRVTGLIGFGGEGKSSLARHWLDKLLADPVQSQPDSVFWWDFYTRHSVDEFFEAALVFLGGGQLDLRRYPSTNARMHFLAGMLTGGRCLLVLDGLEEMQHLEGDQYGLLTSGDLREFLTYFAGGQHDSFCLITSRAPVFDLLEYTTYTHRDVDRLLPQDGHDLLRKLGVTGKDEVLDRLVREWDGHALTLSLLGSYLVELRGGDAARLDDLPSPTKEEPRYERVHRVLRRYDEHLSEAERAFLMLFSAFRTPVRKDAFARVFRAKTGETALNTPLTALNEKDFKAMVQRLVTYRILRYDPKAGHYTAHSLVQAHYQALLTGRHREQAQAAHEQIKDYYLAIAGDAPRDLTLDDLLPFLEAVYHACRAGAYDEAFGIYWERIDRGERLVLTRQLGANERALALMQEFFPAGDTTRDPLVSDLNEKAFILSEIGFCLMSLGRLAEAAPFFGRGNAFYLAKDNWRLASRGHQRLAEVNIHLGRLPESAEMARLSLQFARRDANKSREPIAFAWQAWIAHLRGDLKTAGTAFQEAEALERKANRSIRYLYSVRGIHHAEHLRRTGDAEYARRVTEANRKMYEREPGSDLSGCCRVLGDLDADAGQQDKARAHYDEALRIARSISVREVLIEALLARGRWAARRGEAAAARSDLEEALGYAVASGYRLYEADLHVAMAWMRRAAGEMEAARAESEHARRLSAEMDYYWGQIDAAEILESRLM